MRTLLFTLLIAITSGAQIVEITNTVTGTSDTVDLKGRDLNLVFMDGVTNEVSPIGWFEYYYTEQDCIDYSLPLWYTNKLWWCHTEEPNINEDTPYIYIDVWETDGKFIILCNDNLNLPWLQLLETNATPYATTFKIYLPDNSPIARWVLQKDTCYFKLSSWTTNCIFKVDASDLIVPGTGGGGTGGGGPPPPPGG